MRGVFVGVAAAIAVAAFAAPAGAVVFFSDDFEGETLTMPADNWSPNYTGFANFSVSGGTVDVLANGNPFGTTGTGKYVDLDGSTRNGGVLETLQQFDVLAGETITLSLLAAGNQRLRRPDDLYAGFRFFGVVPAFTNVQLSNFGSFVAPSGMTNTLTGVVPLLDIASPYQTYTISFTALTSGKFSALIGTNSADNNGPLIDNIQLSRLVALVPEPTSWALMILGFGGAGAALRRRRANRPAIA